MLLQQALHELCRSVVRAGRAERALVGADVARGLCQQQRCSVSCILVA